MERFAAHCGRRPVAISDPWRGTHRTVLGGVQVDVGRMLGDEQQDLAARDFTINAMAVRLNGAARGDAPFEMLDPFGGRADLEHRRIRMLSPRALSDDPLRMLRAARYQAELDGFALDPATRAAIAAAAASIDEAAAERVQGEWARLLAAPGWLQAAGSAFELGIGERTLPAIGGLGPAAAWAGFEAAHGGTGEDAVVMRLAAILAGTDGLDPETARAALVERRWPQRTAQRAGRIAGWALALDGSADTVSWALDDPWCAARAALLGRALADPADAAAVASIELLASRAERAAEEPWVRGSDLRDWGLDEGPAVGRILREAARGQLERRWESAAAARAWARRRIDAGAGG
jgi:tRNA nucleotidyltransferase/poly(A) polymerase